MTDLVLDLDFDYCVHPTLSHGHADEHRRPVDASLWLTAAELAAWLDGRGLLRPDTLAGVVESHEQVLAIWRAGVESGKLRTPFSVLHVDAHPDIMDLEPALARKLESLSHLDDAVLSHARPGDFLQFVVRLGWVDRIWMLFPDREQERIAALRTATTETAESVVRKPVARITSPAAGGVEILVRIGARTLAVELHTRASLPALPPPALTVLAHSPEFVPAHADLEFSALAHCLGASA